jgi:hypothetical protein
MDTKKMRACTSLLPKPGNIVVTQCLDEIDRLRHALELIHDGQKDGAKNTNIVDYIDAVLASNCDIMEAFEKELMTEETTNVTAFASTDGLLVTGAITGPSRTEKTTPDAYRLAKRPDGTLVLQGAYMWQKGWNNYGHDWRDIPTVDLETPNTRKED